MKTAIEKLRELRVKDSSIVAIAKDRFHYTSNFYQHTIPEKSNDFWEGYSTRIGESLDFGTEDWTKCIVTYKDLEEFEVEMMAISKADYDRLLDCEKKLENILNIISK